MRVLKRPGEIISTSKARKEQSLCLQGDDEENIKKGPMQEGWEMEREREREFALFHNIRSEMR